MHIILFSFFLMLSQYSFVKGVNLAVWLSIFKISSKRKECNISMTTIFQPFVMKKKICKDVLLSFTLNKNSRK